MRKSGYLLDGRFPGCKYGHFTEKLRRNTAAPMVCIIGAAFFCRLII